MALELKLYDTLTREKRVFTPIDPAHVRMYVCGPTVYDFAHIGNARPVIVFDVLYRLLRHIYGEAHVKYVRNITDVDDKINARAAERGVPIRDLTEETYQNFKRDVAALGCQPPTVEPRATEHIEQMKTLIERLVASGHAYVAEENVLFNVPSMADYGRLSKRSHDEMIAGARVEVAPYKKDAQDFVLWKPSKPGEPGWPSPAGIKTPGRPGWHIECSAMAWQHLGETFDIHGGGIDLVFPHHENEIAQSRCSFNTSVMANYWMHNGFLEVEGRKMAKSEGNFITIRDLLRTRKFGGRIWSGSVLKFAMLQTHYTQPIDWTVSLLEQCENRLDRWRKFAAERTGRRANKELLELFFSALANDLNTPSAFSNVDQSVSEDKGTDEDRYAVYKILKFLGIKGKKTRVASTTTKLQYLVNELGAFSRNDWENISKTVRSRPLFVSGNVKPETKLVAAFQAILELSNRLVSGLSIPEQAAEFRNKLIEFGSPAETDFETRVRRLVLEREAARKAKDFKESDRIRDELAGMGVVLKDSKDGTTWEVAR